jgi:hypothetical protein
MKGFVKKTAYKLREKQKISVFGKLPPKEDAPKGEGDKSAGTGTHWEKASGGRCEK